LASNGRGAPARLLEGKMSHAIGRNEWLKRAGTTSIPLPKVSLKLGGGAPARLGKKLCRYPWRAGRGHTSIPFVGLASNVAVRLGPGLGQDQDLPGA
jgi:hypothetical protein